MDMSIRFPKLNLVLDYVPKSFQVFGFEITIYGILVAVGMLLGIAFVLMEAKREGQNPDQYQNMAILSLLAGVVGARVFYVVFSWSLYKSDPLSALDVRSGGLSFYGGLLGGVLAAWIYCRIRRLSFGKMADIASMGILIGQIIGRWGNFFNRESFGEYTDSVLAMQLPLTSVSSSEVTTLMRDNLVTIDGISYVQVQPAFLYESLWCLILLVMLLVWRRRKLFQGEIFMRYLAGYGLGRFFIEWISTDKILIPGTRIGISLVLSAALFLVFTVIIIVKRIMAKKRAAMKKRRRERYYEAEEKARKEPEKDDELQAVLNETERIVTERARWKAERERREAEKAGKPYREIWNELGQETSWPVENPDDSENGEPTKTEGGTGSSEYEEREAGASGYEENPAEDTEYEEEEAGD
ncbi:MAG: prolipoprotein diacylglyceryl transferase, partial [Clostridiales bacterium]|nr:prolipoprotein diacylglyceryl transferase [Clostridiales bacterium]